MENVRQDTKSLTKMAVLAAMVFIATFAIRVPSLHGYTHPGDSMIFLAVILLGTRKGALAGGLGAALADLISGYAHWIIPTFFIKFGMAVIMGLIMNRLFPKLKFSWLIGAVLGGLFQIAAYTFCNFIFFNLPYAIAEILGLFCQTGVGLLIAIVVVTLLTKSNILEKLKEM